MNVRPAKFPMMTLAPRLGNVEVIAKIENVFGNISDSLSRGEQICIPLRYKTSVPNQPENVCSPIFTNVAFPARTPQEARRFSTTYPWREIGV